MNRRRRRGAWVVLIAAPLLMLDCVQGPRLRAQIAGLEKLVDQAARNGALRCAPRELAVARSQLEFASLELDRGFASKAEAHLAKAELNARAADLLSPAAKCSAEPAVEGATDRDGDGYADVVDRCPDQPENFNGFQDDDGGT